MTEERRLELLRRVLQYDVEDAIARYEAEMGCCVANLSLQLGASDEYVMELEMDRQRPPRPGPLPLPRMLVFNFGQPNRRP
jgi:hypothetical protein